MAFEEDHDALSTPNPAETTTDLGPFQKRFEAWMQTIWGQTVLIAALVLALVIVFCFPFAKEVRRVFGQRYKFHNVEKFSKKDFELERTHGPFGIRL